ncbi:DUF554 domain-containing protein [Chloroflexia bacterium SDU3-3]|nr:DUF554 domain-containing protein [Chloroflexia bacterium SDU3-3]
MTSGTWINAAGVLAGTALGAGLRARAGGMFQQTLQYAVGLISLLLGIQMAMKLPGVAVGPVDGILIALVALALGAATGEALRLEERLAALGDYARRKMGGGGRFSEGLITPFLLFCIGPMSLLGSIANGVSGDMRLLLIKATLDSITAVALTCTLGPSVGLSTLPLVLFQASVSLIAGALGAGAGDPSTSPMFVMVVGVGGVLILGITLRLLDLTPVRTAALLPALVFAPVLYALCAQIFG